MRSGLRAMAVRAMAVTVCPRCSACRVMASPVRPEAARTVGFTVETLEGASIAIKCRFGNTLLTNAQSTCPAAVRPV
jgi:hypothetical protein